MKLRFLPLVLVSLAPATLLTQCVAPYPGPDQYGGGTRPYNDVREGYRTDMNEYSRDQSSQAYDSGMRDGANDAAGGMPRNSQRNERRYNPAAASAYRDGYDRGYGSGQPQFQQPQQPQQQPPPPPQYGGGSAPAYPTFGSGSQPANDPVYNQGYDYGIRDRVAQRPSDPDAHTGTYDPRYRQSFQRGYAEGYESRR